MSGNNSNTQPGGLAQIIASVQQITQDFGRMSSSAQMFNARMRSLSLEVRGPRTRSFEHLPLYRDVPPDIQNTVESLLAKQKASGKALADAATAFAQGLIQWVEQMKQRQPQQKLQDAGNQSDRTATGQRTAEASRLTNLAQSYLQLADNNNQIAAAWRETGGEMSDDYQRSKLVAEFAIAIAEELQRRAFILTTATESNYLQLIFKQYGEDNPDIDKIAAYYAKKFNDQATLTWTNLQHPAPRPRLDLPGTVMMFLSAVTEEAGGIFPATTEVEESGFEKAGELESADIKLKYKAGWTKAQQAEADSKVKILNDSETVVTRVEREGTSAAKRYRKAGNILSSENDADHKVDLQLGGADTISNIWPLNSSVNRSLGAQIQQQIKNLPVGTPISNVTIGD